MSSSQNKPNRTEPDLSRDLPASEERYERAFNFVAHWICGRFWDPTRKMSLIAPDLLDNFRWSIYLHGPKTTLCYAPTPLAAVEQAIDIFSHRNADDIFNDSKGCNHFNHFNGLPENTTP